MNGTAQHSALQIRIKTLGRRINALKQTMRKVSEAKRIEKVGELDELERRHPSLYRGICDDTGAVRRHVNLFVNNDHMRDRDGLDTALKAGDEVFILPAVSGG